MPALEVTFARAIKIWWSFLWRSWVLAIVPWLLLVGVMYRSFSTFMTPPPRGGAVVVHNAPHLSHWLVPISMLIFAALQVIALRWTFKEARWSDFRIQAVSDNQE